MADSANAVEVDRLDIVVDSNSQSASESLQGLIGYLERAKSTVQGLTASLRASVDANKAAVDGINRTTEALQRTSKATEEASSGAGMLQKAYDGFKGVVEKVSAPVTKLLRSIGRIAFYRAVRTAIRSVTSATKEGLANLEAYSRVAGTAYAPAVDQLRQHVLLLKNSLATALRPVIEALLPIVMKVIDAFSRMADFVAQVFSVLTGKVDGNGRYTKAVLGDIQQSNEEAKELRRTLLGFDEINRLDGDTGSGSSSVSPAMNFVQADISPEALAAAEKIRPVLDKIKSAIEWLQENMDKVKIVLGVIAGIITGIIAFKLGLKIAGLAATIATVTGLSSGAVLGIMAIVAALAAMALWGDKIQDGTQNIWKKWEKSTDNFRKKLEGFFDDWKKGINTGNEEADKSLISLIDGVEKFTINLTKALDKVVKLVLDVVGRISKIVFLLVRGDFKGAFREFLLLLIDVLENVVNFVVDCVNAVLGLVSGLINSIAHAIQDFWNAYIAPFFEDIVKGVVGMINDIIDWSNKTLNTNFEKIDINFSAQMDWQDIDLKIPPVDLSNWRKAVNDWLSETNEKLKTLDYGGAPIWGGSREKNRTITLNAAGGFPSAGSMFIAGEAGPEYVGSIGGRSGVMNTDQMASALYDAVSMALRDNPQGGGDIYLDGEVIYRNTVRRNNNRVRATGRSALLT